MATTTKKEEEIMNNGYDVVLNLNKLNIYEKLEQ